MVLDEAVSPVASRAKRGEASARGRLRRIDSAVEVDHIFSEQTWESGEEMKLCRYMNEKLGCPGGKKGGIDSSWIDSPTLAITGKPGFGLRQQKPPKKCFRSLPVASSGPNATDTGSAVFSGRFILALAMASSSSRPPSVRGLYSTSFYQIDSLPNHLGSSSSNRRMGLPPSQRISSILHIHFHADPSTLPVFCIFR